MWFAHLSIYFLFGLFAELDDVAFAEQHSLKLDPPVLFLSEKKFEIHAEMLEFFAARTPIGADAKLPAMCRLARAKSSL